MCNQRGASWVTAGKLLARKRPRLLPAPTTTLSTAS
ncbi:DUF6308 family protein [Streptomyces sp. NPDC101227]